MYFIVVCGGPRAILPARECLSLFADREQSIYREFERTTLAERKLFALLQDGERKLAEVQDRLVAAYREYDELHARLRELHANWEILTHTVQARGTELMAAQQEATAQHERIAGLERVVAQQQRDVQELAQRLAYRETLAGWLRLPWSKLWRAWK